VIEATCGQNYAEMVFSNVPKHEKKKLRSLFFSAAVG
jgi:hypothetical protein